MTEQRVEISVEQAAQIGIGFLMRGQIADAQQLFGKLLSFVPGSRLTLGMRENCTSPQLCAYEQPCDRTGLPSFL